MVSCEICGKEFKTPQALNGHVRFKHGTHPAATGASESVATPVTPVDTQNATEGVVAQMLEHLDDRIGELLMEHI